MPGYAASRETHRIYLRELNGSEDYVDIKAGLSAGARTRTQFAAFRIVGLKADNTPMVDLTAQPFVDMRRALFVEAIVSWSLKANEGDAEPMELSPETYIEVLDGAVGDWLDTQITAYYNQRQITPDTAKNSNGNSSAPSNQTDEFPPQPPSSGSN